MLRFFQEPTFLFFGSLKLPTETESYFFFLLKSFEEVTYFASKAPLPIEKIKVRLLQQGPFFTAKSSTVRWYLRPKKPAPLVYLNGMNPCEATARDG